MVVGIGLVGWVMVYRFLWNLLLCWVVSVCYCVIMLLIVLSVFGVMGLCMMLYFLNDVSVVGKWEKVLVFVRRLVLKIFMSVVVK